MNLDQIICLMIPSPISRAIHKHNACKQIFAAIVLITCYHFAQTFCLSFKDNLCTIWFEISDTSNCKASSFVLGTCVFCNKFNNCHRSLVVAFFTKMYPQSFRSLNLLKSKQFFVRHVCNPSPIASRKYSTNPELNNNTLNVKPNWVPFYKAKYGNHVLEPPVLDNQYTGNAFMQNFVKNNIPPEVLSFLT